MTNLSWMSDAQCAGQTTFTELPVAQQLATCASCTVKGECLEYGMETPTYEACDAIVHGGLAPHEFARLCRTRSVSQLRSEAVHRYLDGAIQAALFGIPA